VCREGMMTTSVRTSAPPLRAKKRRRFSSHMRSRLNQTTPSSHHGTHPFVRVLRRAEKGKRHASQPHTQQPPSPNHEPSLCLAAWTRSATNATWSSGNRVLRPRVVLPTAGVHRAWRRAAGGKRSHRPGVSQPENANSRHRQPTALGRSPAQTHKATAWMLDTDQGRDTSHSGVVPATQPVTQAVRNPKRWRAKHTKHTKHKLQNNTKIKTMINMPRDTAQRRFVSLLTR